MRQRCSADGDRRVLANSEMTVLLDRLFLRGRAQSPRMGP